MNTTVTLPPKPVPPPVILKSENRRACSCESCEDCLGFRRWADYEMRRLIARDEP